MQHVSHGVLKPCKADLSNPNGRRCPFGRHFDSAQAYESFVANQMDIVHGVSPVPVLPETLEEHKREAIANRGAWEIEQETPAWSHEERCLAEDALEREIMRASSEQRQAYLQSLRDECHLLERLGYGGEKLLIASIMQDEAERGLPGSFDRAVDQGPYTRAYLAHLSQVYLDEANATTPSPHGLSFGSEYAHQLYTQNETHLVGFHEGQAYGAIVERESFRPTYWDGEGTYALNDTLKTPIIPNSYTDPELFPIVTSMREELDGQVRTKHLDRTMRNVLRFHHAIDPLERSYEDKFQSVFDEAPPGVMHWRQQIQMWKAMEAHFSYLPPIGRHKDNGYRSNYRARPDKTVYTNQINETYGKRPVNGFVVIDTETTDLRAQHSDVIEYGLVYMDTKGNVLGRRSFIQRPQSEDGYVGMTSIHRIDKETAAKGVDADDGAKAFFAMTQGWIPVAHNADFDRAQVNEQMDRAGLYRTKGEWVDTMLMFHRTGTPRKPTHLKNMTKHFNVDLGGAHHSALFDAAATAKCFQQMLPDWDFKLKQIPNPKVPNCPYPSAPETRGNEVEAEEAFWNKLFS